MERRPHGRFISLEGGEGAGKSTLARALEHDLHAAGIDVVRTREPGGSPGAEAIRALLVDGSTGRWSPMVEALLHYAARCDHLERTIRPALESGQWVISDRFADSTLAYQGYGQGLDPAWIAGLHRLALADFAPDLTLVVDLPAEVGLARTAHRGEAVSRYERMPMEMHRRLRDAFLDIARQEPQRCVVIDGGLFADGVQEAARAAIRERLGVDL